MAQLALDIQNNAPRGQGPPTTSIPSSFTVALDTVSIPTSHMRTKKYAKIPLGPTCADVPGNCRVSEEATWFTYTLKQTS